MAVSVRPTQVVVDRYGKPTAVILSFLSYRKLLRLAEDREDARTLKQAIRSSRGTISHAELLGRLRRQRLI
jgi:hypothetical protein